ncbi:MAG: DMT family transporter [Planctomycetes bacterium]|nr:DMT family transporter [Planctomycetota bacterium]
MPSPAEIRAGRRRQRLALLALVLSACLWSLNGPLIKLLRQPEGDHVSGASAAAIACYRSLFGGAFFLPLALRRVSSLRQVRPIWPIASVVTFTFMTTCFVIATTLTSAANAIVLQYLAPLVVFALSPLMLGIRPRWSEGGVLLLSLVGAAILCAGGPAGSGHVKIMFDVSGRVSSAVVDGGPFPGTAVGGCIAKQFRTAMIPPFCGADRSAGRIAAADAAAIRAAGADERGSILGSLCHFLVGAAPRRSPSRVADQHARGDPQPDLDVPCGRRGPAYCDARRRPADSAQRDRMGMADLAARR